MSEQRLIDANALDSALLTEGLASALIGYPRRRTLTVGEIRGILQKAPTVPVEIVAHGKWREDTDPADGDLRCTHCGVAWPKCVQDQIAEQGIWTLQTLFKYCPNCGARMDKEAQDERND